MGALQILTEGKLDLYTLVPECGDVLHAKVWMIFIAQKCVTFFDFTYLLLF